MGGPFGHWFAFALSRCRDTYSVKHPSPSTELARSRSSRAHLRRAEPVLHLAPHVLARGIMPARVEATEPADQSGGAAHERARRADEP